MSDESTPTESPDLLERHRQLKTIQAVNAAIQRKIALMNDVLDNEDKRAPAQTKEGLDLDSPVTKVIKIIRT